MDFYLGQIGIYGFNFAPRGWALCDGALLPVSQNTALFSLVGTLYGGNGTTTFALPDLRSRTPIGAGPQTVIGQVSGTENVTLTMAQMPMHGHAMAANDALATQPPSVEAFFAQGATSPSTGPALPAYVAPAGNVTLNQKTVSVAGGGAPHENIQPSLAVNFCIATTGIYPQRG